MVSKQTASIIEEQMKMEAKRRKELFNSVMANVTPMETEGKGRTLRTITGSVSVPLSLCYIDKRYQGMRLHKRINRLEQRWDVTKLLPIVVVPHPEEYCFAVVDGQGRCIVAPKKGKDSLFATVLLNAPEDPTERLKFEARYFSRQNSETECLKAVETHQSQVIDNVAPAVIMDKLLTIYGVKFVTEKGHRKESVLGSYTETYRIASAHGEKCLDFIFSIINNAGWNKEKNGYSTFVVRMLKEIWCEYPNDRSEIHDLLSEEFRKTNPHNFRTDAVVKYPGRDYRISCVLHLEDMFYEKLHIERKIHIED